MTFHDILIEFGESGTNEACLSPPKAREVYPTPGRLSSTFYAHRSARVGGDNCASIGYTWLPIVRILSPCSHYEAGIMTTAPIYVISGGTGASGGQLVNTALAQFQDVDTPVTIVPEVRHEEQLEDITSQAAATGGVIVHTLVDADLRHRLNNLSRQHKVAALDLIGPLLLQLTDFLGREPLGQPGLYRQLRAEHFKRMDAFEFAVRHDDGRKTDELDQAEIVLVGVSRVGKTSLNMYLSMEGWKTANVPLVKDIPLPPALFEIDPRRVVGLIVDPVQLGVYRHHRQRSLGMPANTPYTDPAEHVAEIEFSRRTFRRAKFAIIDTTGKPIEESADEIIARVTHRLE